MSYLINRNPSGRIICLHALLKYVYNKFKKEPFTLNDLKFDVQSKYNIHQTCPLLKKLPSISFKICPYLENPLSDAKCYLTQSIQEDKQKSKSVSDVFNALEGMGFVERKDKGGIITKDGIDFISQPYDHPDTLIKIRNGLLRYGPFIGLLNEISKSTGSYINRSSIKLGYPVTDEKIIYQGSSITLSTGSQQDTITRTRSVLFIWAITAGFVLPEGLGLPKDKNKWHVETLDYIKLQKWTKSRFKSYLPKDFFKSKITVENPLSYDAMTKSTKALRERNQEEERNITLKYEPIINNRRFAIVYGLAKKSEVNQILNFDKFLIELKRYPDLFVVNKDNFEEIMDKELEIANVSGIPYEREKDKLVPLTELNITHLKVGAPQSIIKALDKIISKI